MTTSLVGKIFSSLDKANTDDEAKAACLKVLESHRPRAEQTQHLVLHSNHRKEHPSVRNPFKALQTFVKGSKSDDVATAELFSVIATHLSGDDVLSFPQWDSVLTLAAKPTEEFLRFACGKCFPCASLPQAQLIVSLVLKCLPQESSQAEALASNHMKWVSCVWRMLWDVVPLWAAASHDDLQAIFALQCNFSDRFGAMVGAKAMAALEHHMAQSIHYRAIVMAASESKGIPTPSSERPEARAATKQFPFILLREQAASSSSSLVQEALSAFLDPSRPIAAASEPEVGSYDSECHILRAMVCGRSDGPTTAMHLLMLVEEHCAARGGEIQLLDRVQTARCGDRLLVDSFDQGHRLRWAVPHRDGLGHSQSTFVDVCQWWKEECKLREDVDAVQVGDDCALLLAQKLRAVLRLEREQNIYVAEAAVPLSADIQQQGSSHDQASHAFLLRHLMGLEALTSVHMNHYLAKLLHTLGPSFVGDTPAGKSLLLYASMLAAWLFADEGSDDAAEAVWFVLRILRHSDVSNRTTSQERFQSVFVRELTGLGYQRSNSEGTARLLAMGFLNSFWWNVQPVLGLWLLLWRERCGENMFAELLAAHWAHRLHALSVQWDGPVVVSPTYWSSGDSGEHIYAPSVVTLVCSPIDVSLLNLLIGTL